MASNKEQLAALRHTLSAAGDYLKNQADYPLWFALSEKGVERSKKPGLWVLFGMSSETELHTLLDNAQVEIGYKKLAPRIEAVIGQQKSGGAQLIANALVAKKFTGPTQCLALGNVANAHQPMHRQKSTNDKFAEYLVGINNHISALPRETDGGLSVQSNEVRPVDRSLQLCVFAASSSLKHTYGSLLLPKPAPLVSPSDHSTQAHTMHVGLDPLVCHTAVYNNLLDVSFATPEQEHGRNSSSAIPAVISPPSEDASAFFSPTSAHRSPSGTVETTAEAPHWTLRTGYQVVTISEKDGDRLTQQDVYIPKKYTLVHDRKYETIKEKAEKYDALVKKTKKKKFHAETNDKFPHRLIGAVMAKYPSIVPRAGEQLLYAYSYVLLNYVLNFPVSLDRCMNISPSASWLAKVVDELAVDQTIAASVRIAKAEAVYFSTDHGDNGACVKRLFYWLDDKLHDFTLDVDTSGKKGADIADAFANSVRKLFLDDGFTFAGQTSDSGGGQLEELAMQMKETGLAPEHILYLVGSCGLHNMQSIIREPLRQFLGDGGLSERTALQSLHAVYDLQKCLGLEPFVARLKAAWDHMHPDMLSPPEDFPKCLEHSLQEPILSRWWTVSSASKVLVEFWLLLHFCALNICKGTTTNTSENKIASGLYSLTTESLIYSDTALMAAFHDEFLNVHFSWFQGVDPVVKVPGFLSRHVPCRCFLMFQALQQLQLPLGDERHQGRGPNFKRFLQSIEDLEDDDVDEEDDDGDAADAMPATTVRDRATKQKLQRDKYKMFLEEVQKYFWKHMERSVAPPLLLLGIFAEKPLAKVCADFLLAKDFDDDEEDDNYFSEIHQATVSLREYRNFLDKYGVIDDFTKQQLAARSDEPFFAGIHKALCAVSEGYDIWKDCDANSATNEHREFAKRYVLPFPSTNHDTERSVKQAKHAAKTGRKETKRSLYTIAMNGFSTLKVVETGNEEDDGFDDGDVDVENEEAPVNNAAASTQIVTKPRRGKEMGQFIFDNVADIVKQLQAIRTDLGDEDFKTRREEVKTLLTAEEESVLVQEQTSKLEEFKAMFDEERDANKRMQERGYDFMPAVIGNVRFSDLRVKDHKGSLLHELTERGVFFQQVPNFTTLRKKLQEVELASRNDAPDITSRKADKARYNDKGLPKYFRPVSNANFKQSIGLD